jgi:hypothetical protein
MKRLFTTSICSLYLLILTGCSDGTGKPKPREGETEADRKAKEELARKQKEIERSREDYREQLKKTLNELDELAKVWKEKTDTATGEAKQKMQEEMDRLNEKRKHLGTRLDALKDASGDAWDEVSAGTRKAVSELKDAFEKAKEKFK